MGLYTYKCTLLQIDGQLEELGQVLIFAFFTLVQTLMSVSMTMEVATTTAMTQMEVILVPAIMATNLTAMDILVKVGKSQ